MIIWVLAEDCIPPHSLDLQSKHDREKVEYLAQEFAKYGFDPNFPALVGYPLDGKIQLLTGTHRQLSGELSNTKLPVSMFLRSDIEKAWGTPAWQRVVADIPVLKLMEKERPLFTKKEYIKNNKLKTAGWDIVSKDKFSTLYQPTKILEE